MARLARREGSTVIALRTEGAVIIPKAIRERLGLRAGDLFEVDIRGSELVLRPRLLRGLRLSGQPAAEATDFLGLVRLGGDSVRDKARLYEPEDSA